MLKLVSISIILFSPLLTISASAQSNFWAPTNGPGDKEVRSLATDRDGHVFAGTACQGAYRSTDHGSSWRKVNVGLTDSSVLALSVHAGNLIAGTLTGGIFRSTDDGDTWSNVLAGEMFVLDLAYSSSGTCVAGVAGNAGGGSWGGVFISTNSGGQWTYAGLQLVSGVCVDSWGNIVASATDVYSQTPVGIYRSTDNGSNWTNVYALSNLSIPLPFTTGFDGHFFCLAESLRTSVDEGQSWASLLQNPDEAYDLISNSSGHIFAATSGGVYHSTDDGMSWSPLNGGLTDTVVFSLALDSVGFLYAGTSSGVVFRSVQSTTSVRSGAAASPSAYVLEQNYPNPFNPKTVISYQLSVASQVHLGVYDLLGRAVAVLVDEKKGAGSHSVSFDGMGLASGVYFYRLTAGSIVECRKMVLAK